MTDYLERDDGTKMPVGHLPVPKGDVAVRGQTFHGKRIVVEAHGQGRAPHKRERFVLHEYVETITTAPMGPRAPRRASPGSCSTRADA